jgi:hypothetical protein
MKGLFQSILSFSGLVRPKLPAVEETLHPSLSSEHHASVQLSAWLEAFNTGDRETLLTYHDSRFPYHVTADLNSVERELNLAQMTGGFHIVDLESISPPSSVVVLLQENNSPKYARVSMEVDASKSPYPVTKFNLRAAVTPIEYIPSNDARRPKYEKALQPLTEVLRRKLVHKLVKILRDRYIYPALADKIIANLESHLEKGDYDSFVDSEEFSRRLTSDMLDVSNDKHLCIVFTEPPEDRGWNFLGIRKESDLKIFRRINFDMGELVFDATSVPGRTIARLPIYGFLPYENAEVRKAIAEIISKISDADALIVDLRWNDGGDPDMVAFIMSYLLDDNPRHLLDFVHSSGKIEQSFNTLPKKKLPSGSKVFGGSKPLYVLTSNATISGGEDMAYSLQAFKRATAIIGEHETTAGAANPVTDGKFICQKEFGKYWWLVLVPDLKPVHEITGTNWEGVGVKSDIVAEQGEWKGVGAEEVARRMALKSLTLDREL